MISVIVLKTAHMVTHPEMAYKASSLLGPGIVVVIFRSYHTPSFVVLKTFYGPEKKTYRQVRRKWSDLQNIYETERLAKWL